MEKYNTYTRDESSHQMIELQQNFRSRASVLTCINDIFYQIATKIWEVSAIPVKRLCIGGRIWKKPIKAGIPRYSFWWLIQAQKLLSSWMKIQQIIQPENWEAKMIAERIKSFTDEKTGCMYGIRRHSSYRKACYKDMVILLPRV